MSTAATPGLFRRVFERVANPILIVDMKSRLRRTRFIVSYTVTMALVSLVVVFTGLIADAKNVDSATIGKILFLTAAIVMGVVCVLVFPAFSCTAITEERQRKSFDLLVTTGLSPWRIVLGKLYSCVLYCGLFIVGSLPVISMSFLYGGVSISMILLLYYTMLMLAALISAFGIMSSSSSRESNVLAIVRTYAGLFPLLFIIGWLTVPFWMTLSAMEVLPLDSPGQPFTSFGGFANFLVLSSHPIVHFMLIGVCICWAVNRLSPQNTNLSRRMRLAWLVVTGIIATYAVLVPAALSSLISQSDMPVFWLFFLIPVLVMGLIGVSVFSSELESYSRRMRKDLARLKGIWSPLRILFQGGRSGFWFSMGVTTLLLVGGTGALSWTSPLPFLRYGWKGFLENYLLTGSYCLVLLFFFGNLVRVFCELIKTRVAALIAALVVVLLTVAPPVFELTTKDETFSFMSPWSALFGIWNTGSSRPHPDRYRYGVTEEDVKLQGNLWTTSEAARFQMQFPKASGELREAAHDAYRMTWFQDKFPVYWISLIFFAILGVILAYLDRMLGPWERDAT